MLFSVKNVLSNKCASLLRFEGFGYTISSVSQVEELVGHRTIKGRQQFLVRWKGYGNSADTWENEKDLNCSKLIEEFLAKDKDKETKSPKSKKFKSTPKKQADSMSFSLISFIYFDRY